MIEGLTIRLLIALSSLVVGLNGTWFVLRTFDSSSKIKINESQKHKTINNNKEDSTLRGNKLWH